MIEADKILFEMLITEKANQLSSNQNQYSFRVSSGSSRAAISGAVESASAWMRAMDIYTNVSFTEALSVAVIEAMALSRPIVATDIEGNPIVVAHGETGLLSRPADPQDLAEKILGGPVRIAHPAGIAGLPSQLRKPGYSAAVGALLWGIKHQGESRTYQSGEGSQWGYKSLVRRLGRLTERTAH